MSVEVKDVALSRRLATGVHLASIKPTYWRLPFLAVAIFALVSALWGGLLRLGWFSQTLHVRPFLYHGPLMVCGFLGTLISLERAVALGKSWGYLAPALTGLGAVALLGAPDPGPGAILITAGSLALILNFSAIIYRQPAIFTVTMAIGAVAWLVGNCLWLYGLQVIRVFQWWAAFLVITIAGERMELSRLTGVGDKNRFSFVLSITSIIMGLLLAHYTYGFGIRLMGLGIFTLAWWLWRYDLARRTVRQKGVTRFIAANLIVAYFWLAFAGIAWCSFGSDLTPSRYDIALHSVFLGFVFSMIFAHAPVIFPAILQRRLPYRKVFYVHCGLLQLSLAVRVVADMFTLGTAYRYAGMVNVLAVLLFVGNTIGSLIKGAFEYRAGLGMERVRA